MNKLNPTFNDFATAEKTVADLHDKILADGSTDLNAAFNAAYDDMVVTAFHVKLMGRADPVRAAKMSSMIELWHPVRIAYDLA